MLLRSVGRRLAEGKTAPADGTRARLEAAAGVLNELGGLADVEERRHTCHSGLQLPAGRRDTGAPRGLPHGRGSCRRGCGRGGPGALRPRREAMLLRGGEHRARVTQSTRGASAGSCRDLEHRVWRCPSYAWSCSRVRPSRAPRFVPPLARAATSGR